MNDAPKTQSAPCTLSEEELWSGLDRADPETEAHIETCAECRDRAQSFRVGVAAVYSASMPAAPPMPAEVGGYRIVSRLGQGGMGVVYEGEQQSPKRRVAVKVVRGGSHVDPYRLRLFRREAQTLARLRHPNIGQIYSAGSTEDGQHFFAMELVRGRTLTEFALEGAVPKRKRLELFHQIVMAISYAHQRGVIHRDIKPNNILVESDGTPKILDFGLARITEPDSTQKTTAFDAGNLMGTLPYMSPEEARGAIDEIDVRSDVYSLGVVLYELMTGELPLRVSRKELPEAIRTICEESPRRPSTYDKGLRGDIETIVLKALEKDPRRRYQTADALAEDIERSLTSQPILARPAGLIYRTRKFIVRHSVVVLFSLALAMVTVSLFVWVDSLEKQRRESLERNERLRDLRIATMQLSLASKQQELGELAQAEQGYRESLRTFERLGRVDARFAGRAHLALAQVLIDRWLAGQVQPEDPLLEAEEQVWLGLRRLADSNEVSHEVRGELLAVAFRLYGPGLLDLPELVLLTEIVQQASSIDRIDADGVRTADLAAGTPYRVSLGLFLDGRETSYDDRIAVLEELLRLYGPGVLNAPNRAEQIRRAMERLEHWWPPPVAAPVSEADRLPTSN